MMRRDFSIPCLAKKPLRRALLSLRSVRAAILIAVLLGQGVSNAWAGGATFVERVVPLSTVPEEWTYIKRSVVASPDSTRVAFKVSRTASGYAESVIVDNILGFTSEPFTFGPTFSPDSKHVAWVTVWGGAYFLVKDHRKKPVPEPVTAPIFSPDSTRTAYVARDEKKRFVVVDGRHQIGGL